MSLFAVLPEGIIYDIFQKVSDADKVSLAFVCKAGRQAFVEALLSCSVSGPRIRSVTELLSPANVLSRAVNLQSLRVYCHNTVLKSRLVKSFVPFPTIAFERKLCGTHQLAFDHPMLYKAEPSLPQATLDMDIFARFQNLERVELCTEGLHLGALTSACSLPCIRYVTMHSLEYDDRFQLDALARSPVRALTLTGVVGGTALSFTRFFEKICQMPQLTQLTFHANGKLFDRIWLPRNSIETVLHLPRTLVELNLNVAVPLVAPSSLEVLETSSDVTLQSIASSIPAAIRSLRFTSVIHTIPEAKALTDIIAASGQTLKDVQLGLLDDMSTMIEGVDDFTLFDAIDVLRALKSTVRLERLQIDSFSQPSVVNSAIWEVVQACRSTLRTLIAPTAPPFLRHETAEPPLQLAQLTEIDAGSCHLAWYAPQLQRATISDDWDLMNLMQSTRSLDYLCTRAVSAECLFKLEAMKRLSYIKFEFDFLRTDVFFRLASLLRDKGVQVLEIQCLTDPSGSECERFLSAAAGIGGSLQCVQMLFRKCVFYSLRKSVQQCVVPSLEPDLVYCLSASGKSLQTLASL